MIPGKTVITFAQGDITIVAKDVSAIVCDLCGAWYVIPEVLDELRRVIESEAQSGHEISVIKFPKAA